METRPATSRRAGGRRRKPLQAPHRGKGSGGGGPSLCRCLVGLPATAEQTKREKMLYVCEGRALVQNVHHIMIAGEKPAGRSLLEDSPQNHPMFAYGDRGVGSPWTTVCMSGRAPAPPCASLASRASRGCCRGTTYAFAEILGEGKSIYAHRGQYTALLHLLLLWCGARAQ